jgi:ABC-type glycerol-3-phosphate transport system substrate-binding protein
MRRIATPTLTTLLLALLAWGAAQSGVLRYNSYMMDPVPRELDERIVEMFMERYPDIRVEHSQIEHETFKQAIRTFLVASPPPDVLTWFAGERMRFFARLGLAADVGDVWEDADWEAVYPAGAQAMSQTDGTYYFVPAHYYWWAVYYRSDIFDELGLQIPETWEVFLDNCRALDAAGYIPVTIGTRFRWPAGGWFDYLNMRVNGPEFHIRLLDGLESYESEEVRNTFAHWQQALDAGCFIDNPSAYNWQEAAEFMVQREAAMYLMGQFIMDVVPEDQQANFDFFRFPIIDPSLPVGEDAPTDGYFISANAANMEHAKLFLEFLGSREVAELWVTEAGRLVPRADVDPALYTDTQRKGLDEVLRRADVIAQFYDRDTPEELAGRGMDAFVEFMANPGALDRLLADLQREAERVFAARE